MRLGNEDNECDCLSKVQKASQVKENEITGIT